MTHLDEQQLRHYHRARREAVRAHHPDRGGDPDALAAALHAVDRRYGVPQKALGQRRAPEALQDAARRAVVVARPSMLTRLRRSLRTKLSARRVKRGRYVDVTPTTRTRRHLR